MLWFHVSTSWKATKINVTPRTRRTDSDNPLDTRPFIAVSPSISQCLLALGDLVEYKAYGTLSIYSTGGKPLPATWVFDHSITEEHRFYEPMTFVREGEIPFWLISKIQGIDLRSQEGLTESEILERLQYNLPILRDAFNE